MSQIRVGQLVEFTLNSQFTPVTVQSYGKCTGRGWMGQLFRLLSIHIKTFTVTFHLLLAEGLPSRKILIFSSWFYLTFNLKIKTSKTNMKIDLLIEFSFLWDQWTLADRDACKEGRKGTTLGRIVIFNLKIPPSCPPHKPEHSLNGPGPVPQDSRFSNKCIGMKILSCHVGTAHFLVTALKNVDNTPKQDFTFLRLSVIIASNGITVASFVFY